MLTNQRLRHPSEPAHRCLVTALVGGVFLSVSIFVNNPIFSQDKEQEIRLQ